MKQYLITGHDFTDEGAIERRLQVRQQHLDGVRALKATGNFVIGGAMLDATGKMIGSTMIVQFETEEALNDWKENEIYITARVWERVDVQAFKVADV
jgi:uncharacterized protein YciI